MIQRIQTIFLFLASACGFGTLAAPFAKTKETIQASALFADARFNPADSIWLLALFAIAGALALVGIFLFNNRKTQVKICWVALVANLAGLVMAAVLFWQESNDISSASVEGGVGAFLPFGFMLFGILSLRFIKKDEKLVRSMDRLR